MLCPEGAPGTIRRGRLDHRLRFKRNLRSLWNILRLKRALSSLPSGNHPLVFSILPSMLVQHLIHSAKMHPWRLVGLVAFLILLALLVFYFLAHDNGGPPLPPSAALALAPPTPSPQPNLHHP